jgi:hypothetical protein
MMADIRKWHILAENKGNSYPRQMIFIDTEARPIWRGMECEMQTYLWMGCYVRVYDWGEMKFGEEWFETQDYKEFWEWVLSKAWRKGKLYVFGHNVSYDLLAGRGIEWLLSICGRIERYFEDNSSFIMKWKVNNKTIQIIDTMNYFRAPLAQVGELIGLPKGRIEYATANLEEAKAYCRRDIEIIKTAMIQLLRVAKLNDWGNFGVTLPKWAWNVFRHKFMHRKVYIHGHPEVLRLEREAVYPGRNEAFYIGRTPKGKYYLVDVNSLYPYVASQAPLPYRLRGYEKDVPIQLLEIWARRYFVIAKVEIETEVPYFPVRVKGTVYFPVGRYITTLCGEELLFALEHNHIKRCFECACYDADILFRDYVGYFYKRKMEARERGDSVGYWISKVMMNSLFGKFAQWSHQWSPVEESDPKSFQRVIEIDARSDEVYELISFGGKVWKREGKKESHDSFPAIFAGITSAGRIYLLSLIQKAGWSNVLYVDTDSLIVNEHGMLNLEHLIDLYQLGKIRVETEGEFVEIRGLKDYRIGKYERVKGLKRDAVQVGENEYEMERWTKLRGALQQGVLNKVIIRKVRARFQRKYDKGIVKENGRVLPFRVRINEKGENEILSGI